MPIPSPSDFRNKTKKHSEVREMMAQLAESAQSKDDAQNGRSVIATNTTILSYQQNGSYYGAGNTALTDAPSDRNISKEFVLHVESIIDSNRYKKQTYSETETGKIWFRTIDLQNNVVRRDWARSQVDDASVTTLKLADKAASRPKLTDNFLFNDVLTTGLISDARKDGVYFGTAQNHTDIPSSGLSPAHTFFMEVKDVTGLGRFIHQKITRYPQLDRIWERVVDTSAADPSVAVWTRLASLGTSAVITDYLADGSVTAAKLSNLYRYKGIIDSGSIDSVVDDGFYLVVRATTTENPPNMSGNYFLTIENAGNNYVTQSAVQLTDGSKTSRRTIRPANNVYYDWKAPDVGQVNPFAGKKIAFLGDSITEFGTYPQQVANALGATALNMGIGGTRMSYHELEGYGGLSGYKIAEAIAGDDYSGVIAAGEYLRDNEGDDNMAAVNLMANTDWTTVDYVVVGYGTNDFGGKRPMGDPGTVASDGSTFIGSLNYFIDTLLTAHPHLRLVFTAPIWRQRTPANPDGVPGGSDVSDNTIGLYLIDYVDAIIEETAVRHVESLDLYRRSGIGQLTASHYIGDGVHPLNPGYALLASKVSSFLKGTF